MKILAQEAGRSLASARKDVRIMRAKILMILLLLTIAMPMTFLGCSAGENDPIIDPQRPINATDPLSYNETGAKEFDPDDLPWDNETDIIIMPPITPEPIDNETDTVIIISDPLEELLGELIRTFLLQTTYNADIEDLNSKIDDMETTYNTDVTDLKAKMYIMETTSEIQIESLENEIFTLQNDILYTRIVLALVIISVIIGLISLRRT